MPFVFVVLDATSIVLTKRRRNLPRATLESTINACLCLSTYIHMFTLDTDSLKTLGFNPPTPTLRLRPMTSRLYELFSSNSARLCSLLAQLKRVCKSHRVYLSTNRASARIWADLRDENRAQRKDAYTRAAK